ncbi:Monooxygenase FAD-binding [Penicillium paradoxum]|uniref:Monooxygenase FAD-binding n=1 Tax=Penicillium paradoxum TaxID=176176 RepID=UPI002547B183|nr:Monooxygenase FAD-binding [Penicillium paradoxum]KAJ5787223.1 Monooxygenase FAD-binding [Penicillium paradoxum]
MEITNSSGGFRSHRSYPSLNHVSLAPLTPRFPIDDDTDEIDYFNHRDNEPSASGTRTPPTSSYLSSVSVPSTPPILSHSRSNSRSRHARSKSSSRAVPLSDTNLYSRDLSHPLHHVPGTHKKHTSISYTHGRRPLHDINAPRSKSDAEWMLRAGIALASSTREEKGQSWLSKRETSTSLIPDIPFDEPSNRHHHRTKSGSSRKSRSGASTPGIALSRRGSRRGSRAGLTMTALPMSYASSTAEKVSISPGPSTGTATGTASPDAQSLTLPDFVDEHIRAEMAALQQRRFSQEDLFWEGSDEEFSSEYLYDSDETLDDFDEADLQELTRERGFGLGTWIDRLVEWTLFGVDEWPAAQAAVAASRIGTASTTTTVTFEEPVLASGRAGDTLSLGDEDGDVSDGDSSRSDGESNGVSDPIEKPGARGGWEDAGWLFRVVKRALV